MEQTQQITNQTILQPWILPATGRRWNPGPPGLTALADDFAPITLNEMDAVALLDRTDTKFTMSDHQLVQALGALQQDYWILSVNCQRLNHYRTLYFDTPEFDLFRLHVNGRADRYKVRSREYTDSCESFLEVKHRTSKGRTIKNRIPTVQPVIQMTLDAEKWLGGIFPYNSQILEPKIWNTFTRITLVNKYQCERVTLDINLSFYTATRAVELNGIAIAEVKMGLGNQSSLFLSRMRALKIHPQGFSKYCIGVSMLYDQVKKNSLKPDLIWIKKMTNGAITHE